MSMIADKAWALTEPVCAELGLQLVEIDYRKHESRWVLAILVDKVGGVAVSDLSELSSQLNPLLDLEGFIPNRYVLEVSSPGVMRALKSPDDFRRFSGRRAKVFLSEMVENRKRFVGIIQDVVQREQGPAVVFELSSGERLEAPFALIWRASLHYTTQELLAGVGRK